VVILDPSGRSRNQKGRRLNELQKKPIVAMQHHRYLVSSAAASLRFSGCVPLEDENNLQRLEERIHEGRLVPRNLA